ncbi:YheC/YheD family protein [Brevibacillus marinus]|uniref:YheC/YheD family endospore coat-associated protein n=1 Tax=Brevibacillus marinus TaxID=2496837 RepID=UPI000F8332A5|nr:YheC/YheD family protein [Brevibacillus marinus]
MKQIGILLDMNIIRRARQGLQTYERLNYYQRIGKELGLEPVFFHPQQVNFLQGSVKGYLLKAGRLVPCKTKIPPVVHNRVLTSKKEVNQLIHLLGRYSQVYNGVIERNKLLIHQLLWKQPALRRYLPETKPFSREALHSFLRKYRVIYIKRVIGYIGHGVIRIERQGNRYLWISSRQRRLVKKETLLENARKWLGRRPYLIQRGIPLNTYNGQPFDIRVSVQKNGEGMWNVTGMVAKVANPQNKLSNLAQGGRAVPIDQVLFELFEAEKAKQVKEAISQASLAITRQCEQEFPSLADVGLDVGIDDSGMPYFIELNVRDQRYSFLLAGEEDVFRNTYRLPLEYAKCLLEGKVTRAFPATPTLTAEGPAPGGTASRP